MKKDLKRDLKRDVYTWKLHYMHEEHTNKIYKETYMNEKRGMYIKRDLCT